MKCTIPEISWHNRDPVLSVDVQPLTNEGFYRLATGGTDSHVLMWHLKILETGATTTEPVSDLTRHQRAVNVVRWSHSGQYLASGDDDSNIIIWHQKSDDLAVMLDGENDDKEKWSALKVLRGHKEDVYDICWSPDSTKLISGSVDNTAIIWDLNKGLNDNILTDHKGFVQGVTWDPLGQFIATLCSDRICRVFSETGKQVKARSKNGQIPVPESHVLHGQVVRYFHDDTLKSFFRRLTFSPDGSFIITPAGCLEMGPNDKNLYTSYIYATTSLTQPAAILPSPGQYTVAARCCPILFQLRQDGPDPLISLPYRIVFAIATRSSVILYDTQQVSPFATISNIHYTRLTDLSWSQDGRLLTVSSTDGFCSLVTFEPNELGIEYVKETEVTEPESNETLNDTVEEVMEASLNISIDDKKEKKPSFLEKWTKRAQSIEEKDAGEKPEKMSRIEVRRKFKESMEAKPGTSQTEKKDKPVSRIEVRRKPKEALKNKEVKSNVINEVSAEKPVSKIEVKRKAKEAVEIKKLNSSTDNVVKEEKPISRIEVRRKSKVTIENQELKLENQGKTSEKTEKLNTKMEDENAEEPSGKQENVEPSDTKTITSNEEKPSTIKEDDDVIIIENEKENENKQNVLKPQNENKIETPLTKLETEKDNNVTTPKRGRKLGMKNPQNSTPAKSIAVKRKPREPPGGQMNITQFLKSPKPVTPAKTKAYQDSKKNPFILLEDYSKTGKIYEKHSNTITEDVILIDNDSSCEVVQSSVSQVLNFEDDSQNIKLVLEETVDEPPAKIAICSSLTSKEINKYESDTKSSEEKTEKLINGDCENSNESINNKEEMNGDIKPENCDTKESISKRPIEKVESENPTPLSIVLSLPKDSPAKKRVPLITLSSPKHKKKPF